MRIVVEAEGRVHRLKGARSVDGVKIWSRDGREGIAVLQARIAAARDVVLSYRDRIGRTFERAKGRRRRRSR